METYKQKFIRHQLSKRLSSTMFSGRMGIGDCRPGTNTGVRPTNPGVRPTNIQQGLVYQMRKSRGINWTHEEKVFLVSLCAAKARVIEEKKSDSNTLRMKAACWKVIYDQFSARFGRKRTLVRIKEQWKRMKLATRAEQRDRVQEMIDTTGNGNAGTQESVPTKYYGESAEIIAQVKHILNQVANSSYNVVQVSQNGLCPGEVDSVVESLVQNPNVDSLVRNPNVDSLVRYPDVVTRELQSDISHSTPEPEPVVIKIEIDDDEEDNGNSEDYCQNRNSSEDYSQNRNPSEDYSQNRNSSSAPEPDTGAADFNSSLGEVDTERHGESEPISGHAHTPTSGYNDVTQNNFSNDFVLNTRTSTPEVHLPSYDPAQSSEQWTYFQKQKSNAQNTDSQESRNNSRTVVDSTVLEYARIEHEKKMEYLKKEHEMKLEILELKRQTAMAKLRKANFKLSLTGAPTYRPTVSN